MTIRLIPGDTQVKITNIANGITGYVLDSGVRRKLSSGASMFVTADELRQLSYRPGGTSLIANYLRVDNKDLAMELGVPADSYDHEYQWDQNKVDQVLTSSTKNSMDELLDALDYAPDAIKDLIASRAVELEISDVNKRKAIQDALGFDVTKQIEVKHAYDSADETVEAAKATTKRRASSAAGKKTTTRRTATAETTETE